MKKLIALIALASILVFSAPVTAKMVRYTIDVYAWKKAGFPSELVSLTKRTGRSSTDTSEAQIQYKVFWRNTDTVAVLFSDKYFTSKTNPVTTTVYSADERIKFMVDDNNSNFTTTTGLDILIVDINGGFSLFFEDVIANKHHTAVIDQRPGEMHHGMMWWDDSAGAATDTGVNFLADTVIHDMWIEVTTVGTSAETIDIETADTANGFLAGVSTATLGHIDDTGIITAGTSADYTAVSTYGSLLAVAVTGADEELRGKTMDALGGVSRQKHPVTVSGTDDDLYFDTNVSFTSFSSVGIIHYMFQRTH